MKKLSTKLSHPFVEWFMHTINAYCQHDYFDHNDKLVIAGIHEVWHRLYIKTATIKKEHSITFTPVQALSIHLFFTNIYDATSTNYEHNELMKLSNQINQLYA
jgi:hypothetical protein